MRPTIDLGVMVVRMGDDTELAHDLVQSLAGFGDSGD
jgi:hypothetical protein